MICLRFTKTKNEKNNTSIDNVNHKTLSGLCCYDITDEIHNLVNNEECTHKEAYQICAKKEAEHDNWHCSNHDGNFVIFDGSFVEFDRDNQDRFGGRAVVATLDQYLAYGKIEQCQYGYKWKDITVV